MGFQCLPQPDGIVNGAHIERLLRVQSREAGRKGMGAGGDEDLVKLTALAIFQPYSPAPGLYLFHPGAGMYLQPELLPDLLHIPEGEQPFKGDLPGYIIGGQHGIVGRIAVFTVHGDRPVRVVFPDGLGSVIPGTAKTDDRIICHNVLPFCSCVKKIEF